MNRLLERPGAQEPFTDSFALYTDSADSLSWLIAGEPVVRELAVNSFWDNEGSLSRMETEIDGRGSAVEVVTSIWVIFLSVRWMVKKSSCLAFGNSQLVEKHAGELVDLYIDSAGTDLESDIVIKMDSGYLPWACRYRWRTCRLTSGSR